LLPRIAILSSDLLEAITMAAGLVGNGYAITLNIASRDGGALGVEARSDGEVWPATELDEDDALRLFGMRARALRQRGADLLLVGGCAHLCGWPAAAILGVHHGIRDACSLWAPAAPQDGFTTSDGVQMRAGLPLPLPHASLLYQIHSAACGTALDPERERIATVRGRELAARLKRAWRRGHRLPVCDAESQGDLERIVGAALAAWAEGATERPLVMAGTHALATALAAELARNAEGAVFSTTWPTLQGCRPDGGGDGATTAQGEASGHSGAAVGGDELGGGGTPLMVHGRRAVAALFAATATTRVRACGMARGGFVAARPLDGSLRGRTVWMRNRFERSPQRASVTGREPAESSDPFAKAGGSAPR
jgi:hypothetical protein